MEVISVYPTTRKQYLLLYTPSHDIHQSSSLGPKAYVEQRISYAEGTLKLATCPSTRTQCSWPAGSPQNYFFMLDLPSCYPVSDTNCMRNEMRMLCATSGQEATVQCLFSLAGSPLWRTYRSEPLVYVLSRKTWRVWSSGHFGRVERSCMLGTTVLQRGRLQFPCLPYVLGGSLYQQKKNLHYVHAVPIMPKIQTPNYNARPCITMPSPKLLAL